MNNQQLLILSFFDKDLPRKFTSKDLTSEMIEAGIELLGHSASTYINLVHQLKTQNLLLDYKDPLTPQEGSYRPTGEGLLVLSDSAVEILNRDQKRKEHEASATELEFKKLRHEYDLLSNQLVDYDETKTQARNSYKISIWSFVVAILSAIVSAIALIHSTT